MEPKKAQIWRARSSVAPGILSLFALAGPSVAAADPGIALRVDESQGLSPDEVSRLSLQLAEGIQQVTGTPSVLDEPGGEACGESEPCARAVAQRAGGDQVVLARLFAGGTRIRWIIERVDLAAGSRQRVQADLQRKGEEAALAGLVQALFPERRAAPSPPLPQAVTAESVPPVERPPSWVGYGALGSAAILGGTAIALRLSADSARARIAAEPLTGDELESLKSRASSHGVISNVVLGLGGAVLTGGIVYLLMR
ncbi:MAG: hypothetical protein IT384_16590 [Deltaproteobacteria bacterium]|nr:hypothetical protein [Deltaproteobacteria bacterium]